MEPTGERTALFTAGSYQISLFSARLAVHSAQLLKIFLILRKNPEFYFYDFQSIEKSNEDIIFELKTVS